MTNLRVMPLFESMSENQTYINIKNVLDGSYEMNIVTQFIILYTLFVLNSSYLKNRKYIRSDREKMYLAQQFVYIEFIDIYENNRCFTCFVQFISMVYTSVPTVILIGR